MRLFEKTCQPLPEGSPTLAQSAIDELLPQLEGWRVIDGVKLAKDYRFKDFARALAFVNQVGEVAEAEDHHPEIWFTYGEARLEIRTHSIGGLSENDFILAAKLDRI
ncbi:MAG: 4a-hydroxytetrahydrobiopterin dehydratase [Myxococcota bacterium]